MPHSVTAIAADFMTVYEAGREAAKAQYSGLAQLTGGFFLGIFYLGYALIAPTPGPETWRQLRSRNALGGMLAGIAALQALYAVEYASYGY